MKCTCRLFLCVRCLTQVLICSRCDRGQIYCSDVCSKTACCESSRAAGHRYQQTPKGRHKHAERARRPRQCKNKVTHQDSITSANVEQWRIGTIAAQLAVHHSTVARVLTQAGLPRIGAPRRASAIDPYWPFIRESLEQFPKAANRNAGAYRGLARTPTPRRLISRHRSPGTSRTANSRPAHTGRRSWRTVGPDYRNPVTPP